MTSLSHPGPRATAWEQQGANRKESGTLGRWACSQVSRLALNCLHLDFIYTREKETSLLFFVDF